MNTTYRRFSTWTHAPPQLCPWSSLIRTYRSTVFGQLLTLRRDAARQVVDADLLKHPLTVETLEPFAGKINMLTASGPSWKKWRSMFNPGFSVQHLIGQVPMMVDFCQKFVQLLDQHASTDRVFRMEEEVCSLFRAAFTSSLTLW